MLAMFYQMTELNDFKIISCLNMYKKTFISRHVQLIVSKNLVSPHVYSHEQHHLIQRLSTCLSKGNPNPL